MDLEEHKRQAAEEMDAIEKGLREGNLDPEGIMAFRECCINLAGRCKLDVLVLMMPAAREFLRQAMLDTDAAERADKAARKDREDAAELATDPTIDLLAEIIYEKIGNAIAAAKDGAIGSESNLQAGLNVLVRTMPLPVMIEWATFGQKLLGDANAARLKRKADAEAKKTAEAPATA